MRDVFGQAQINRRGILISLISSGPFAALAVGGVKAGLKVSQSAVHYLPTPKDGQACAKWLFIRRAPRKPAGRRRDCADWLAPSVGEEDRLKKRGAGRFLISARTGVPVPPLCGRKEGAALGASDCSLPHSSKLSMTASAIARLVMTPTTSRARGRPSPRNTMAAPDR